MLKYSHPALAWPVMVFALAALASCSSPAPSPASAPTPAMAAAPRPVPAPAPSSSRVLAYTEQRLLATDAALDPPAYPVRTNPDGTWLTAGANDWTSGFYAAALWRTYERTRDPAWRQRAQTWQAGLAPETKHDDTDLGFKLFDTYGVGYQLTGDPSYKQVVLHAADTLARRYNPNVGMFRVWDHARRPHAVPGQHRRDDEPGADVLGRAERREPAVRRDGEPPRRSGRCRIWSAPTAARGCSPATTRTPARC